MGSYYKDNEKIQVGWLVGWVEKGEEIFPFAYNIHEPKINDQRLLRVRKLLETNVIHSQAMIELSDILPKHTSTGICILKPIPVNGSNIRTGCII